MTLATLKVTLHSLDEGTGHEAKSDILMEKKKFPNMPEPCRMGFTMRAKVNANHASDTVIMRSRTGFLVYLNCALVYWWSKEHMHVDSLTFGAEFIVMKQCCENLRG